MEFQIECESCGNEYESIFPNEPESWQALECACYIEGDEIQGYYGSTEHDTNVYKINEDLPSWVNGNVICDKCMNELLDDDIIELIKTDVIW